MTLRDPSDNERRWLASDNFGMQLVALGHLGERHAEHVPVKKSTARMLDSYIHGMMLAAVAIQGFSMLGRLVEGDPELAAVVIAERLRKLEVRAREAGVDVG
jgi:hypothetical protein